MTFAQGRLQRSQQKATAGRLSGEQNYSVLPTAEEKKFEVWSASKLEGLGKHLGLPIETPEGHTLRLKCMSLN